MNRPRSARRLTEQQIDALYCAGVHVREAIVTGGHRSIGWTAGQAVALSNALSEITGPVVVTVRRKTRG